MAEGQHIGYFSPFLRSELVKKMLGWKKTYALG
jgi:hypothetical protein